MIEQLFGSKTRVKLLGLFYGNPNRSFFVREITRKIDEQINSVRRELANLLSAGIIISENTNHKLYYEVNKDYEFYAPLREIFGTGGAIPSGDKTQVTSASGSNTEQNDDLKALGHVELAILTGQFTRDDASGVDLLLVGNVNEHQVAKYVTKLEASKGQEITYAILTPSDFAYRRRINDRFVSTVLSSRMQVLVDKHGVVE